MYIGVRVEGLGLRMQGFGALGCRIWGFWTQGLRLHSEAILWGCPMLASCCNTDPSM